MKKIIFFLLFFVFTVHAFSQDVDIRGQIQTYSRFDSEYVALPNTSVDLYTYNNGNWEIISQTLSNQDGYYFFYDIAPGNYYIQVNKSKNYRISVTKAKTRKQFQDLPVLYY